MEKDVTATLTLRAPVWFWRNSVFLPSLAACLCPVIQRCSQPCALQTRSTCPRLRLFAINPIREMELHLLFLNMTPPTTKPVLTDSKCLHVYVC
uniref:Uncharacterized protein n=1 Tax=Cebus imitator TaxID=2715852 RepID=A0A2K5P8P7_CEBIM